MRRPRPLVDIGTTPLRSGKVARLVRPETVEGPIHLNFWVSHSSSTALRADLRPHRPGERWSWWAALQGDFRPVLLETLVGMEAGKTPVPPRRSRRTASGGTSCRRLPQRHYSGYQSLALLGGPPPPG